MRYIFSPDAIFLSLKIILAAVVVVALVKFSVVSFFITLLSVFAIIQMVGFVYYDHKEPYLDE